MSTFFKLCGHIGPTGAIHVFTVRYRIMRLAGAPCWNGCGRFVRTEGHRHCCNKCRHGGFDDRCDNYEADRNDSGRRTDHVERCSEVSRYLNQARVELNDLLDDALTAVDAVEIYRRMIRGGLLPQNDRYSDMDRIVSIFQGGLDRIAVDFRDTVLGPGQRSRQGARPRSISRSRSRSRLSEESICSICHKPFKGQLVALSCIHLFHEACAKEWGQRGRGCAVCRAPYLATDRELKKWRVSQG